MKKIAVLGGYGEIGANVSRLLAKAGHEVLIAGRNGEKAEKLSEEIGEKACPFVVDAFDSEGMMKLCGGADLLVHCASPYREIADLPARCAFRTGIPYMDASGDAYIMGLLEDLAQPACKAGLPFLFSCGTYPGLSGAFPRGMAARLLNFVEKFSLYVNFDHSPLPFGTAMEIVEALQESDGSGLAFWKDGRLERDSSGGREADLPSPVGRVMTYPCFPEEIRNVANDLGVYEGHAYLTFREETMSAIFDACSPGMGMEEKKKAAGKLMKAYATAEPYSYYHLDLEGDRGGIPAGYRTTLFAPVGSMELVSHVMASAAELVLEGVGLPGMNYLPKGIDCDLLLKRLEEGIVEIRVSTPDNIFA